jgi:hypothetical protein
MKKNRRSWRRIFLHLGPKEHGASLVSVLIATGIAGFVALAMTQNINFGLKGQKKVEIYSELSYIGQTIAQNIDCETTLANARVKAAVASNQALCNANGSSGAALLESNPLQLYIKSANGTTRSFTSDLEHRLNSSGKIGQWQLRVGCDWTRQSLVVRAARMIGPNNFAKDPLTGKALSWDDERLLLYGGQPGQHPLCFATSPTTAADGAIKGVTVAFLDTRKDLIIEVPPGAQFTEISTEGQFQGTGDSGADVSTTKTLINLSTGKHSGTQMVKIGSAAGKSRSVYWQNASLGQNPTLEGFTNPSMSENFRRAKMPNPMVRDMGVGSDGVRKLIYTEKIENPGNNGQRWWAAPVIVKHY